MYRLFLGSFGLVIYLRLVNRDFVLLKYHILELGNIPRVCLHVVCIGQCHFDHIYARDHTKSCSKRVITLMVDLNR